MGAHRAGAGGGTFDGRPSGPEDLAGIHADDALIDAVHGRRPAPDGPEADPDVTELLVAWRDQVDAAPMPELVSLDEAVAAVESGRHERTRSRGPRSMFRRAPLVAAAALGVVVLGVGAGAHQSQPGDPLWPMTEVVFSGHADEVRNATSAQAKIDHAEDLVAQRDYGSARDILQSADGDIAGADESDRQALQQRAAQVQESLVPGTTSTSTTPPSSTESSTTGSTSSTTSPSASPTTTTAPSTPPTSSVPGSPVVPPASPSTTTSTDPLLPLN